MSSTPPTPPGMRVRTGRLEPLRSMRFEFTRRTAWVCLFSSARIGFSLPAPVWASPSPAFGEFRLRGYLRPSDPEDRGAFPPIPSALHSLWAATTASADFSLRISPSPFQAQGEISPGKNAILRRTTAGFTPPLLDHKGFAESGLLALIGIASYPVFVHRLAVSLHASSPRSVALAQLRFASLAVVSLREDFHLQDRAHAGRT